MYKIELQTNLREEVIDITSDIQNLIKERFDGICIIYTPHTTCGITINEGYDPDVGYDLLNHLNKLIPINGGYRHFEGNSDAHIKSSLIGISQNVLIENGKLILGKWQKILFCEFDGPRLRQVFVKFIKS